MSIVNMSKMTFASMLKKRFGEIIPVEKKRFADVKKNFGEKVIQPVKIEQGDISLDLNLLKTNEYIYIF